MTLNSRILAAAAALALLVLAAPLSAQTAVTTRVHIPFSFEAGERILPAGDYTLQRVPNSSWLLHLTDVEHNKTLTLATTPAGAAALPKLVFERAGGSLCLVEVHVGGAANGFRVPMTRQQAALAKLGAPKRLEIALARP